MIEWPFAFGFVGSLAIIAGVVIKWKSPAGNKSDIRRIDVTLENHEKELKDGTERMSSLHTKIELVSQTVDFMKETQGRMDRCQQKQSEAMHDIQLKLPEMEGKIKESVKDVFDEKVKELQTLIYGKEKAKD